MERSCMETDGSEFINLQEQFTKASVSRHQTSLCLGVGWYAAEFRQSLSEPQNRNQIYCRITTNDPPEGAGKTETTFTYI